MGCVSTPVTPDVWPPSNPPRQGTAATGCRLWHNGLFFTGFQSGRLAALKRFPAGYGCHWLCYLKTWLFTVSGRLWHNGLCFNAFHSGRLAALKPSPAGYGCHWLQALAQWAVFYRLSIRTFGRPQTFPGRALLHPSATASAKGLRKLDFTLFRQALALCSPDHRLF